MISKIIFLTAVVITISGCLIYSERLYVRELKLKSWFWLIIGLIDIAALGKFVIYPYRTLGICCLVPLIYWLWDIMRVLKIAHAKIPRYNWLTLFLMGMVLIILYWKFGGDLLSSH